MISLLRFMLGETVKQLDNREIEIRKQLCYYQVKKASILLLHTQLESKTDCHKGGTLTLTFVVLSANLSLISSNLSKTNLNQQIMSCRTPTTRGI